MSRKITAVSASQTTMSHKKKMKETHNKEKRDESRISKEKCWWVYRNNGKILD